jgi:tetratricopeptide (TPR) repeat protein
MIKITGKLIIMAIGASLFTACGYINSEIYRNQTTELYNQGKGYYQNGDYTNAEACFQELVNKDARHPEGIYALGATLYIEKKYNEAIPYLEMYLEREKPDDNVISMLIDSYLYTGRSDEVDTLLQKIPEGKRENYCEMIRAKKDLLSRPDKLDESDLKLFNETVKLYRIEQYQDALKILNRLNDKYRNHLPTSLLIFNINAKDQKKEIDEKGIKRLLIGEKSLYLEGLTNNEREIVKELFIQTEIKAMPGIECLLYGLIGSENGFDEERTGKFLDCAIKSETLDNLSFKIINRIANAYWRLQRVEDAVKLYELSLKKNKDQPLIRSHLDKIYKYRLKKRVEL